jgi:uncharacterized membrane protein
MGWAALLPLVLATLGWRVRRQRRGRCGRRDRVLGDSRRQPLACVLAYGLGMVLFTMIMGNAFAAFPVMTAGIGLPR